jgi:hypothetical protein
MISALQLLIAVLVVGGCYLLGKWGFKFDTGVEIRREAAGAIAGVLESFGFKRLAEIFRKYSTGDYSGFINCMIDFGKLVLSGEEAFVKELDGAFDRMLDAKLANPVTLAYVKSKVDAVMKPATTTPATSGAAL